VGVIPVPILYFQKKIKKVGPLIDEVPVEALLDLDFFMLKFEIEEGTQSGEAVLEIKNHLFETRFTQRGYHHEVFKLHPIVGENIGPFHMAAGSKKLDQTIDGQRKFSDPPIFDFLHLPYDDKFR